VNPMAQTHSVIALPWCARGDYPALLKLFSDPDTLPETYDAWLKRAECTESQMWPGVWSGTFLPIKRRA
jgi:hypothetical protein